MTAFLHSWWFTAAVVLFWLVAGIASGYVMGRRR